MMDANTLEKSGALNPAARKSLSLILQALSNVGQGEIARKIGVSDTTISRLKSERLEEMVNVLVACGLKVVPQDYQGDHSEFIDAALVFACYGIKAVRKDQRLLAD